jgi:predicted GNAT family acetyltransferase
MQPLDFASHHAPALETNEPRHNLILAIIQRLVTETSHDIMTWTLGASGQCAVKVPNRPIVLGEPDADQCRRLADITRAIEYSGVVGPDETARHFAEQAGTLGLRFADPMPQRIYALRTQPRYPGAAGHSRRVTLADAPIFAAWMMAFHGEATPHDPSPRQDELDKAAGSGRYQFWIVDGEPVSVAGIVRQNRNGVAIAGVYTPTALRGRGYAGSVTAALVERALGEGKRMACLYTDLRNPFSNRCYVRIGFQPVCDSMFYPRAALS